jgi:hypothetical protein
MWWPDPDARSDIHLIVIGGQSTWTAPGGVQLGQTLEQAEKLNHKPFKLKGFDKDRIATVSDWDGGALASLAGDCTAGLNLRADPKTSAAATSASQPKRNTVPPIRQFVRQSRSLARF